MQDYRKSQNIDPCKIRGYLSLLKFVIEILSGEVHANCDKLPVLWFCQTTSYHTLPAADEIPKFQSFVTQVTKGINN